MTEPESDGTLQFLATTHQDVIDDAMVNPVPGLVADIITRVYAEAEKHGRDVIQWRVTFSPYTVDEMLEIGRSDEDIAWMRGRRVVRMTACTTAAEESKP